MAANTYQILDFAKRSGLICSDAKGFDHLQGDLAKFAELIIRDTLAKKNCLWSDGDILAVTK